jgi:hypothetical protein
MESEPTNSIIQWLLDSDPSIRWQVLCDLLNANEGNVSVERQRVASEGWGACLLGQQDESGRWGGQLYSNKWLSTTYTLQLLCQMGLEQSNQQAHRGCHELIDSGFKPCGGISYAKTVDVIDNGVTGMILRILAYFRYPDERLDAIVTYLLDQQRTDGRWEPVPNNENIRYTIDTTLLILVGLLEYEQMHPHCDNAVIEAQKRGREYLLQHHIYKSLQTGTALDDKITLLSFPPRWHYDILAALDYFQSCQEIRDERLVDAINILQGKCNADGTWDLQNRHAGKTFFEMEQVGKPSRWNTLRSLRVLKWYSKLGH